MPASSTDRSAVRAMLAPLAPPGLRPGQHMSLRCGLSPWRAARDRARPKVQVEVVKGAASIKGGRRGELERGATLLVLRGKALPEPQYRLLEMWYVDRLSVGEIASALGLATSQVSIHLTYLSKTLRAIGRGRKRAAR